MQKIKKINPLFLGLAVILILITMTYCSYRSSTDVRTTNTNASVSINANQIDEKKSTTPKNIPSEKDIRAAEEVKATAALKNVVKDPSSMDIRNQNGWCGEINSKNGFGGYTGFRRFVASPQVTVIEGENMEADEFQKVWDQICK